MNIEHKLEPIEHWIVDGKAYRLATEKDVGKECYRSGCNFETAVANGIVVLHEVDEDRDMPYIVGCRWKYAYIQDDSLLTPQRTPVPALGEGWYLLRDDEVLQDGDRFTATSSADSGWVDITSGAGLTLQSYPSYCRAARYFGPAKQPEAASASSTKPIDWTKPVRTKDGRAVRVLCTDGPDAVYPVIGIIADSDPCTRWTICGKWWDGKDSDIDLENVPSRIQREYWVNVYRDEACNAIHATPDEANRCADDDRIACVKITIDCEEGEGL